jgi:hypothetical protein
MRIPLVMTPRPKASLPPRLYSLYETFSYQIIAKVALFSLPRRLFMVVSDWSLSGKARKYE